MRWHRPARWIPALPPTAGSCGTPGWLGQSQWLPHPGNVARRWRGAGGRPGVGGPRCWTHSSRHSCTGSGWRMKKKGNQFRFSHVCFTKRDAARGEYLVWKWAKKEKKICFVLFPLSDRCHHPSAALITGGSNNATPRSKPSPSTAMDNLSTGSHNLSVVWYCRAKPWMLCGETFFGHFLLSGTLCCVQDQ